MAVQAATVGDIVRYDDASARKRLRLATALAVVFWLLLIGSKAALPWPEATDNHPPHAVATTMANEFAVVLDHPHVKQWSVTVSQDIFAAAVVPRITTVLVALGLVVAAVAAWMYAGHTVEATVRGPPRALALAPSGRQLLALVCISRR